MNSFEGFRLDVAKVVTPTFFASHLAFFGAPQFPQGYYQVRGQGGQAKHCHAVRAFDECRQFLDMVEERWMRSF